MSAGRLIARALVFDLDGVLVDSESVNVGSAVEAFGRLGFALPATAPAAIVGRHPVDYGPELAELVGLPRARLPELLEVQDRVYRDRWAAEVRPVSGALRTVRALSERGFRLALATSAGRAHVEACFERFGLRDLFLATVCKEDVRRRKPDPEVYRRALERLGEDPLGAVAVEDSPHGIDAARAAGMRVVAVRTEAVPDERLAGADVRVDRIEELVDLLRTPAR